MVHAKIVQYFECETFKILHCWCAKREVEKCTKKWYSQGEDCGSKGQKKAFGKQTTKWKFIELPHL